MIARPVPDHPRCLGIVTARGGSKGIPDKNLRPLAGKSMVQYAVEAGQACPYIDTISVTTDSPAITAIAHACGADVPFVRPDELATDLARQEDAILHAMDWYESHGETFDLICLLQPTEPLRRPETLNRGFELLRDHPRATGVMSVAPAKTSPLSCNTLRPDGTLRDFIDKRYLFANRQERPAYYELSGLVTIATWSSYRETETFCQDTSLALIVDPIEALDIDEPQDFLLAATLLEAGYHTIDDLARAFTTAARP